MAPQRRLRILLTNDDGLEAPGLAALEASLPPGATVVVAAPSSERSACSHQVTTHRPVRVQRRGEGRYAVDSMPADCVRVALHDHACGFDWVLAGINNGANLGADIYYSGTVAAAREATLHGIPAMAISHYRNRAFDAGDWSRAARWVRSLLPGLLERPHEAGTYWNVNLPSLPPGHAGAPRLVECDVETQPLQLAYAIEGDRYTYQGVYRERARRPASDVDICFRGSIAVSRLKLP